MKKIRRMGPETITMPCGSPLPAGAACICDCISTNHTYHGSNQVCICDTILVSSGTSIPAGTICICDTISVGTKEPPSGGGGSRTYWYPN